MPMLLSICTVVDTIAHLFTNMLTYAKCLIECDTSGRIKLGVSTEILFEFSVAEVLPYDNSRSPQVDFGIVSIKNKCAIIHYLKLTQHLFSSVCSKTTFSQSVFDYCTRYYT